MFGRVRAMRSLVALFGTSLVALPLLTVVDVAPVRATTPPAYYAIALGMVSGVTSPNAMNEAGVLAAQVNGGLARITDSTIEQLPPAGGTPYAITGTGTIVGFSDPRAFRVDGTTVTTVPGIAGSTLDAAFDINEAGTTIVGVSSLSSGEQHAWMHDGTGTTDLGTLGGANSVASKINGSGLIAGTASTASGATHFVTWQDGAITDLGNISNSYANVIDMNEAGRILGGTAIPGVGDRAVVWDGTALVDLGTLGGSSTFPTALNEAGKVVVSSRNGSNRSRAALWDAGSLVDLGTLPGGTDSYAGGINDHGQITGTSDTGGGRQHGFLIDSGVMYDINDLLPAHSIEITSASTISDSGHIIADGANGSTVLLVPGTRPTADYDVIDLGTGLGPQFDAYPRDMNATRQATGLIGSQAFRFDGSTSSFIFVPSNGDSAGAAINSTGTVVGYGDHNGNAEAFRYDGAVHFLGSLGGVSSNAQDINDAGDIVGQADATDGQRHAFLYRGGVMTNLDTLGGVTSYAAAINESGIVIGNYSPTSGTYRGFVSDGTTTTDLGTLGGTFTAPSALNESGEIVGTSSTASQPNHAFRYSAGTMTSIAPPGSTSSEGVAINESGVIAGSYLDASGNRRAFKLDNGAFTLIPGMGGTFATATDINASGQVVGYAITTSGVARGYLFDSGQLIDLTTRLPLGYEATIQNAVKIGDDGTILARGQTGDFRDRAVLLVPTAPSSTPPLTIDASRPAPGSVPVEGRFEKEFTLNRTYGLDANDPNVIDVSATFTAPSGATFTVPAFFGTDYSVRSGTGVGSSEVYDPVAGTESGVWHARFSPSETGTWRYTLKARDHVPGQQTTIVSAPMTFSATPSTSKGQVERDPRDDRFLRYANGTPYLPMGENVAFQQGEPVNNDGEHYVEPLFASMEAAGQNWTGIWMTDFNRNALEWSAGHWAGWYTGVGHYAAQSAFRIERQLDVADQHGLQVQLVLNDHGQVRSMVDGRWAENPYNAANGGPVPAANPEEFFTNATAKQLFKQRLRYLVARYGSYRNLLAWELFNEVQFVGSDAANPGNSAQVRSDIVAWHAEMAAYLRSIDPYHHLITTSSDIESSLKDIWADPNIDLVQVHDYDGDLTHRDVRFRGYVETLNGAYHKPVIMGEFGIAGNPEVEFDPVAAAPLDDRESHLLQATHLHNAAWSSAMSASGAMSWWWGAYIYSSPSKNRVPPDFPANERVNPPLRDFFAGEDLAGMGLGYSNITAPATIVALGLDDGSKGFAWIRDAQNEYGTGVGPGDVAGRTMSGVSIAFSGFTSGTYRIEVHDPWGVAPMDDSQIATASGGTLTVALPDFTRDIAIKIRPAAVPGAPTNVTAAKGNSQANVSWTAPASDGGSQITGYTVTSTPGGLTTSVNGSTTSALVTGLTNGTTYTFTVTAMNTVGTGPASAPSNAVTPAAPVPQSITFTKPPNSTMLQSPRTVSPTASSGLPVTLTSSTTSVCTVSGYTITLVSAGTCTITASQPGNADYLPASPVTRSFNVTQATQTITFTKPPNSTMLQSPLTVSATASSGLPVTLTSSTTSVCTVSGFTITLVGPGTCTIAATQPGNNVYAAAASVIRSFTVSKAAQTITFAKPPNSTLVQSPLSVSPTASSGLAVTLTSTTTAVCTVTGFSINLLTTGTCTIMATQPGNSVYLAATAITRSFTVSKAPQTITLPNPGTQSMQHPSVVLNPSASSGLTVTLATQTPSVCTVSGNTVSFLKAGTCKIRATQAGNATYLAAPAVTITFTVTP